MIKLPYWYIEKELPMKKKIVIYNKDGAKEQEVNYIPVRFIIAILLI